MKVYTRGGDKGKTSLFSGERVSKHHLRIEAYGDLDELNSILGAVGASVPDSEQAVREDILSIQEQLFQAGAWLATTPDSSAMEFLAPLAAETVDELENKIDAFSDLLPALKEFILPGGHPSAAWAHVARTVCRRCERRTIQLDTESPDQDNQNLKVILMYLNRLSDYLFVLARYLNKVTGVREKVMKKK